MNFDNLCVIFSYLDWKDLVNCRHVNKLFRDVADREEYWRECYAQSWDNPDPNELLNDGQPVLWRDLFINKYRQFGRYIKVYKRVRQCWKEIEHVLSVYHNDSVKCLLPGVSEEELDAYETANEITLPDDYRCSMRIHNAEQYRRSDPSDNQPPVLGLVNYYHISRAEYLLPLKWDSELLNHFPVFPEKTVRDGLIPLSMSKRNHLSPAFRSLQLMSVDEKRSGIPSGTVFYWVVRPQCDPVYHYHYTTDTATLQDYVRNAVEERVFPNHKMATSFIDWLENIARKYRKNVEAGWGRVLDYVFIGYHFLPRWVCTTEHVTVRAGIRFIPEESQMNFFWTYRIVFEMAEDAPQSASCVLEKRHWEMTDTQGRTDVVDGDGVIGEYPRLTPGTIWMYSSCTHLTTDSGTMEGYFTFRTLKSGTVIRVICPRFELCKVPS